MATSRTYTIFTGGPVVERVASSAREVREYVERNVGYLRRRGYSATWSRSGQWHVCHVLNTRGRQVHEVAFRPGDVDRHRRVAVRATPKGA